MKLTNILLPSLLATSTVAASTSTKKTSTKTTTSPSLRLKPTAGTTWNIQLITPPKPSVATASPKYQIWDFDLFDSSPELIASLKKAKIGIVCYFSAGSWEDWRDDADTWPKAGLGKDMDGWAGEKWVDVRNQGVRDVIKKRIEFAAKKGCDGIDPDNIDGYNNPTGFPLTQADAVSFVTFLSQTAHANGLSYGLKNGGDIVPQVVHLAEWVVNEECTFYNECELYKPFIDANKPVLHIEYPDTKPKMSKANFVKWACSGKNQKGFSTLVKNRNLDGWTKTC